MVSFSCFFAPEFVFIQTKTTLFLCGWSALEYDCCVEMNCAKGRNELNKAGLKTSKVTDPSLHRFYCHIVIFGRKLIYAHIRDTIEYISDYTAFFSVNVYIHFYIYTDREVALIS